MILAYCGGVFAAAMALAVVLQGRRSLTHWCFALGMAVLAAEGVCAGLSADALLPGEVAYWQQWRLLTLSLLPGPWLVFAMSYGRGDSRKLLQRRRPLIALSVLAP